MKSRCQEFNDHLNDLEIVINLFNLKKNNVFIFFYLFSATKVRHNRKVSEILKFRLNNLQYTMVSRAILYIYVHGENWIRKNDPTIPTNRSFSISVNRIVLRNPNQPENILLRKEYENKLQIPQGDDEIIKIDVTQMVSDWFQAPQNNHGMIIKLDQYGRKLVTLPIADREKNDHVSFFFFLLF